MPLYRCRKCNAEILETVVNCPRCGCHYPFLCVICGREVGMLATIGGIHPFNSAELPLCQEHARHLCTCCKKPFEKDELSPAISHWEIIETMKTAVPIQGNYCASCKATHIDPPQPNPKAKKSLFWFLHKRA